MIYTSVYLSCYSVADVKVTEVSVAFRATAIGNPLGRLVRPIGIDHDVNIERKGDKFLSFMGIVNSNDCSTDWDIVSDPRYNVKLEYSRPFERFNVIVSPIYRTPTVNKGGATPMSDLWNELVRNGFRRDDVL
jgi:hypothetical protein